MWIQDSGWKKFGSAIRDKHPGAATLLLLNLTFSFDAIKSSAFRNGLTVTVDHPSF